MSGFDADAVHVGVNAAVGAAAALELKILADHLRKRRLQGFLHGVGVRLYLPAVKAFAVVCDCQQQISQIAAFRKMSHTTTPPMISASATKHAASLPDMRRVFILVRPVPPR